MSPLSLFLSWHRRKLQASPYSTNAVQSALLMGLGDAVAQRLERGEDPNAPFSLPRLGINVSWAAGVNAPFWTWWYFLLERRWKRGRVAGWVLASAAMSPLWNGAFFAYNSCLMHVFTDPRGLSAEGRAALNVRLKHKLETQLVP